MKKTAALLTALLLSAPLFSTAEARTTAFHRFLITLNSMHYPRVCTGTVLKIIPGGYRKGRLRLDLLKIKILTPVKPRNKTGIVHFIFRRRNFEFIKRNEQYLFFATRASRLSYIDPPHKITGPQLIVDQSRYPLKTALHWATQGHSRDQKNFLKQHKRFIAIKRTRDRKAAFRLRILRKEALLLYKIHHPASLKEKVSLLLELGQTRVRLAEYNKAQNTFYFVKQEYRVAPIVELLASRGAALATFYKKNRTQAIREFKKLLQHPAGKNGYRAVLHLDLGRLYETAGKTSQAITQYNKAATLYPERHKERSFAYFNLGELHRKQRQYKSALSCYKQAYSIFNNHLDTAFRKGNTHFPAWYFVMKQRIIKRGK